MGIYKDVMGTLVRVLAADNINKSTKQSWQKLIDADLRQGGTDSSISVRDKFDYDCCLHALLHSHLAPVQWDVLVAKYSTHKANKVAAIGRLISRIQSPAPQLFIYKALTAWAIPKLKGVQVAPRSGREVVSRGLREDLEHAAIGKEVAAFVPSSDADRSILREREFKMNAKIRADLKQPRKLRFNGLVHGLGRVLSQNIDRFSGKQSHDVIKALQLESGVYCDEEAFDIPGLGQLPRKTPRSLSYDSMGEETFQDFWRQCRAYLVLRDWPTLTEERLTEMAEFEAFKEAA